jgi:hypothetical protein
MPKGRPYGILSRRTFGEVHTLLDGAQGYPEKQLPIWNEDLLSIKPKGLEDIHEVRPAIVRPKLDH